MAEFLPSPLPSVSATIRNEQNLRLLVQSGLQLNQEQPLDNSLQAWLDAAVQLCGAAFGTFHYSTYTAEGAPSALYKIAGWDGVGAEAFQTAGGVAALFAGDSGPLSTPAKYSVLRHHDLNTLSRQQQDRLLAGFPPCRSYMAVPLRGWQTALAGALVFGHPVAGTFLPECEDLVAVVAAQAAIHIENARLNAVLSREVEQTRSTRALQKETADRLRQALDAAQLGTWSWDRASDLLELDEQAQAIFGVQHEEHLTRSELRRRVVFPEDASLTTDRLRESVERNTRYYAEYRIEAQHGPPRWVAASGTPLHGQEDSSIRGMVGTVQDITARKTQEATLRESEKLAATGRLAATIAHEINNPLEAITNLIYLSRTDPSVPAPVQSLLQTADNELARVSQIAQQTLGFYRDTTRPVMIEVDKLLAGTVDLFERKMRSRSLTCILDLEPGLKISALQGEIRQVFSNLLVNAIDASFDCLIQVRARRCRQNGVEGVSVLIADRGAGIPLPVRQHLFAPFITTKDSVGTGLGLWVTRGFVEKQGGSVRFRTSTEPPTGTVFRVFLPVCAPADAR